MANDQVIQAPKEEHATSRTKTFHLYFSKCPLKFDFMMYNVLNAQKKTIKLCPCKCVY